jgi:2-aminoethylphosphonate dioxygenase
MRTLVPVASGRNICIMAQMFLPTRPTIGTIDTAQASRYRAEGYLVVRQLFSADRIAELEAETVRLRQRTDLIDTENIRCRWQNDVSTGECRFDCFDPVIDLSIPCERTARDPRLLDIIGSLYGEPACLFKDKLIFKAPGTLGYNLHQDYISWKSFPTSFLTVIVAVDAADAENGATEVFPGYHQQGCLTARDGMYHQLPEDAVDLSTGVVLDLAPGDIAIFSGYTPHRSAANRSPQSRRLLYLSYNAFSDGGEQRDSHYAEFRTWLKDRYAEHGRTSTFFR